MQHAICFKLVYLKKFFNKLLMQCSHSKDVNIIQMWGFNYNKTKLVCIDASITYIKTFENVQKMENMNSIPLFMPKETWLRYACYFHFKIHLLKHIFISHHIMCSSISSSCCNHLKNMLISVKLIVIQLELNDIDYKLVFHSYSKFALNTWYTLIGKFENYKPNPKKLHGYEHI